MIWKATLHAISNRFHQLPVYIPSLSAQKCDVAFKTVWVCIEPAVAGFVASCTKTLGVIHPPVVIGHIYTAPGWAASGSVLGPRVVLQLARPSEGERFL